MRKLYIVEKVTKEAMAKAKQLGCPEVVQGMPPALEGVSNTLPCVVIESAVRPRTILAVLKGKNLTKTAINAVVDFPPEESEPERNLEEEMDELKARVITLEQKEARPL